MSATEIDAADVLQNYLSLLAQQSQTVRPDNELKHPKEVVRVVLRHCLSLASDEDTREKLEVAYISLATFQPLSDDEVRAVAAYEGNTNTAALSDQDLTVLASRIAEAGGAYTALQRRVLNEQETLMEDMKKLRSK